MPWLGNGVFQRTNQDFSGDTVWQQDQQAGIKVIDSRHDFHDQDIAVGVESTLNLDGLNSMRADLKMATFKITGLGAAAGLTDAPNYGQVSGSMTFDDGLRTLDLFDRNGALIDTVTIPSGSGGGGEGTVSSISIGAGLTGAANPITTVGDIGLESIGTGQVYQGGISTMTLDDYGRVTQVTVGGFANTNLSKAITLTTVKIISSTGTDTTLTAATTLQAGIMTRDQAVTVANAMRLDTVQTVTASKTFSANVTYGASSQVDFPLSPTNRLTLPSTVVGTALPTSLPASGEMWNDGGIVKIAP